MKKHVVKTLLLMSLVVSSVWSFVGCKDYDEDAYGDLKSRITKETTLREALQLQVDELEGLVKSLETCKCDLSNYLTQQQGDGRYVKISDYEAGAYQISANKTAIELINNAINEIKLKLATVDLHQERIDYIVGKMSDMNDLISEVKATADEALLLAKESKCTCNFTDLENRLKTLEGYIAGWDEQLAKVSVKTDEALARAISDSIMIVKLKKTVDSLSTVVANVQNNTLTSIISSIQKLENNTYTKEQIDGIIRNLPIGQTVDLTPILDRISTIENNYYTKQQVIDLIKAVPMPDLSELERRIAAIEGQAPIDAYTKAEVDELLRNLVIPQTDLTDIEVRLNKLERMYWTREEIVELINRYIPTPVNLSDIERRLTELEKRPTIDSYTKEEVRALINGLNIPDVTNITNELRNIKNTYLTEQQIVNLIKKYAPQYDMNLILYRIANLEVNTFTKAEVLSLIYKLEKEIPDVQGLLNRLDNLESNKQWTLEELITLIKSYSSQSSMDVTVINDILRRLFALESKETYSKSDIDNMIKGLNIPDTKPLEDRIKALEGNKVWTAEEILLLIQQNAYDDSKILERLAEIEGKTYTKDEVNRIIQNLHILSIQPILDRLKALESKQHWSMTDIIALIKQYSSQNSYDYAEIMWRLLALESRTFTKAEVLLIIQQLKLNDIQPIIDRLNQLEQNTLTVEDIIKLIEDKVKPYDDKDLLDQLADIITRIETLEGKETLTSDDVEDIVNAIIGTLKISDIQGLEEELADLKSRPTWTRAQIKNLIKKFAPAYDDTEIQNKLSVLELAITNNYYTINQIDKLISDLNIPGLADRIKALEDNAMTPRKVIRLIKRYIQNESGIYERLAALEEQTLDTDEVKQLINQLIDQKFATLDFSTLKNAILSEINSTLNNYYTKEQITNLLSEYAPKFTADDIWNLLLDKINANLYTKSEVENLIKGIIAAGTGSTPENIHGGIAELTTVFDNIKNKLNSLPESFLTEARVNELITAAIGEIPSAYNDKWLRDMLEEGEGGNIFTTKKYVDGLIQTLRNEAEAINTLATTANNKAIEAFNKATENAGKIGTLETKVGDLEDQMEQVLDDVESLQTSVENLQTSVGTLRTDLDALEGRVDDLEDAVETINGQITQINNDITSLKQRMEAAEQKIKDLKDDIQAMITGIVIQGAQSPVIGYFNAPLDARSTVLATYYGTPMPADRNWTFPTVTTSSYVNENDREKLTKNLERSIAILGNFFNQVKGEGKSTLFDSNTGNAGSVYVTVNPANVDFTGKKLSLLDSRDKAAPIELSALENSNRLLNFGYTRAAGNGFYEAKATIKESDIDKVALDIDYNSLETEIKALVKERSKTSVMELGSTLVKNLQTNMPAYALMGSWTDKSSGKEHKVYSQYGVAVTAVKPLSFAFMQDFHMSTMPGIDKLENLAGDIVDAIRIDIKTDLPDFSKYEGAITFKDFSLPNLDWSKFHVKYQRTFTMDDFEKYIKKYFGSDITFNAGRNGIIYLVFDKENNEYVLQVKQTYTDGSTRYSVFRFNKSTGKFYQDGKEIANARFPLEIEAVIDIDKEQDAKDIMNQLLAAVNEKVGANGEISKQVTQLLSDIASMGNLNNAISASLSTTKGDIKSVLDRYITRLDNKLTSWVNLSPSLLHLALVANADSKVCVLSQSKKNPTSIAGVKKLTLYPTTYTLELLAPAYKKFVAVTDVFDANGNNVPDPDYVGLGKKANNGTNLGKVVSGDVLCTLGTLEEGHIYEITYTAIDYFGKVSLKKYYVRF